jgi:predicted Zn finger-like uncharacterized protein
MKFLCDRCKTRYSIADERVRGKILKIRCKNCSNVITVREGMPEPETESPQAAEARRAIRPTDYQPSVMGAAPAKAAPSPLRDAFAQALEKPAAPPPALEEEWYVSQDGNQEGPFSLTEAQEWVKGKRPDDDLHCWCEGFDDWLPIEKVSHFRGLRARKAPPKAPPAKAPPVKPREEEPKPLFAAALAALEQDVRPGPKTTPEGGNGEPAPTSPRPRRQTAGEMAIAEMRQSTPSPAPATAKPQPIGSPAGARAPLPAPNRSKPATIEPPSALAKATPLTGTPARAEKSSRSMPAFDNSESGGAPAERIGLDALAESPGNGHADEAPVEDDNDFAIGEVSRVVRLQDVVAAGARKQQQSAGKKTSAIPAARATAAVQAMTDAATPASALAEAAAASLTDDHGLHPDSVDEAPAAAVLAPVASRPKRSHLTLMAAGGAALVLIIGLVVFFASGGDDEEGGNRIGGAGGDVEGLAISVDDPRYPGLGKKTQDTPGTQTTRKPTGGGRRPTGGGNTGGGQVTNGTNAAVPGGKQEVVMGPDGPIEPLTPDDVITQALKMSTGTQRCYSRALKDDPFLKVKAIAALISISRDGKVTSVSLDQMQNAPLGQCLVAAIKRWPFRKSTEGLETKITLKFEQTIGP